MANLESIIGFCWWDIPCLILLAASIAFGVIRKKRLRKELDELKGSETV